MKCHDVCKLLLNGLGKKCIYEIKTKYGKMLTVGESRWKM